MFNELGPIVSKFFIFIVEVYCTLIEHSTSQSWLLAESFNIKSELLDRFKCVFSAGVL